MFRVQCEWGQQGVKKLSKTCDVVIVIDVLSFSTSVDIATSRLIEVLPYVGPLDGAPDFAHQHNAVLAQQRGQGGFSLSPASFSTMSFVERIVLPSPNGSTLTLMAAGSSVVLCGCLRNAPAVARVSDSFDSIGVVPAGERWSDGSLRPSLEDWLGAGAIISHLSGPWSPEAKAAAAAFKIHQDELFLAISTCPSGTELIGGGYGKDVDIASHYDSSDNVPRFNPPVYSSIWLHYVNNLSTSPSPKVPNSPESRFYSDLI
jgi:2-phosphosulfolactate phosphatase